MNVDLKNQVALVTGGAKGIGKAISRLLAANGARVAIVDLDLDAAEETAAGLRESGGEVLAIEGDVSRSGQMERAVEDIVEEWGKLSILVNNAGINTLGGRVPIHEFREEDWNRILEVDLTGVYVATKAAVPALLRNRGGRIVNISSVAGLVPLRLQSAFVAAKAGVVNLTRSMALELGPSGILVNVVAPGSTLTRGTKKLFYGAGGSTGRLHGKRCKPAGSNPVCYSGSGKSNVIGTAGCGRNGDFGKSPPGAGGLQACRMGKDRFALGFRTKFENQQQRAIRRSMERS